MQRSVKNLIQTNHYERPFHPEIGSDVRALLPVAPCRTSGGVLQSPRNVGAKASTPSSGHGCNAASSATTRFGSSFTPWPAIWATSCGRLRCRRRWKTGCWPRYARRWLRLEPKSSNMAIRHVPISRGRRVKNRVPENLGLDWWSTAKARPGVGRGKLTVM